MDFDSLVQCLMAMGKIGMAHEEIQAIDVNPLIIRGSSPVAVDALVSVILISINKKAEPLRSCLSDEN